jgi:hypothetical protein
VRRDVRWLLVVQRGRRGLLEHLEQRFRGIGFVQIVLDRRQSERRRRARRPTGERRRPATAREREQWQFFGYRLVYRGQPLSPTVASLRH